MARKRDRFFALFGAILFLLTSSAITIVVIYTLVQQHNQKQSDGAASNTSATTTPAAQAPAGYGQLTTTSNISGANMENYTPTATPQTKLEYQDIQAGTGATIKPTDTITADYVGALMKTGVIFDASADHGGPQTFPLNQVIAGWTQGIAGMKVGGTRRLLIPAALAYGAQAQSGIPANSDLVFDVTVVKN
jgi:FKBP-type peptidyl-prolyl cis-trans isomerase